MFIDRAGAEPAAGLAPRLGTASQLGQLAPPLGLRRSVPSVRGGRDNPTRLRRATRSPLLLGPEQARVSAWGLRPSVLGTVGARLRVGEVEADGAFSSARCARLGARTTSAKPLASGLPAAAAPRTRSPPQPPSVTGCPPVRGGRAAAPYPAPYPATPVLGRGPAPPQMPLRGRVSPVDGLSGPRQYRDEGPPPLGRQRGLHGFWRCRPPSVTGFRPAEVRRGRGGRPRRHLWPGQRP